MTIATTAAGRVEGVHADGIHTFKGVPYAAPPVGEHRWHPPQPLQAWTGVRDATSLPPSCPQPAGRPQFWSQEQAESEDCLYLNVWTPGVDDGAKRPVLVWYHGGGYTIGSGSWPLYDGTNLARRGDAVVITVNHRLGVLGYLHLAEVCGEAFASSGNVGMLDCVAVLEWVRDNAEAFGGDPGNVTIFGESGGGAKVSTLLAMPAAHGLFHRAAIQSGPGLVARTQEQATRSARKMIDALGVSDPAKLWDLDARALVEAQGEVGMRGFGPVVDGDTLTDHPGRALRDGTAADVPILVGCNKDEASMGLQAFLADPSKLDEAALRERLTVYGDHADELLDTYRRLLPDANDAELLCAIQTDGGMRMGSIRLAEARLAGGSAPVWMYFFRWESGVLRSAHGFEIMFVFDNVGHVTRREVSEGRAKLSTEMSEAWLAFARTGDPNHDRLADWPAYDVPRRATMVFDRGASHVEDDPSGPAREVWEKIGPVARASVLGG